VEAPGLYQKELARFGSVAEDKPRYRLHWIGDPMPDFPEHKFACPCDCWALIWWVDNDSEAPGSGGGYALLQAFYTQDCGVFVPTMLDTVGLNQRVVVMMAGEAEKHRRDFARIRHAQLERERHRVLQHVGNLAAQGRPVLGQAEALCRPWWNGRWSR